MVFPPAHRRKAPQIRLGLSLFYRYLMIYICKNARQEIFLAAFLRIYRERIFQYRFIVLHVPAGYDIDTEA